MIFLNFSWLFGSSIRASWDLRFELETLCFCCQWTHRGRLRNQVVSSLVYCDESLTCQGLNLNIGHFGCFTFILCFIGESHLLVSWCAGGRCGMVCSDDDRGRSRRPGAEDRGWLHRSGTRWLDDREVR
jgi:hypothetical protein